MTRQRRASHRVEVATVLGVDRVGHHDLRCSPLCRLTEHVAIVWCPARCTDPEAAIRDSTGVTLVEVRPAAAAEIDTAVYRPRSYEPWTVTWPRTVKQ